MGLAFVQKIVEHHNGSLAIKSDGKRGTTFIIDWPFNYKKNLDTEENFGQ